MRIVIVGGGPCGLGAAWRLAQRGHRDWTLWEALDEPGGLSRSVRDARGFTWDLGGHVLFSHYPLFDEVMDGLLGPEGWLEHERESWARLCGVWLPYPVQYNIHRLPPEVRDACLRDLRAVAEATDKRTFRTFADLVRAQFGDELTRRFMRPYNEKVWAWPLEELDVGWIGERVALPDLKRIEASVRDGCDNASWGPNRTFRFPRHGGTGAIWHAVAGQLPAERLQFGRRVVAVDPNAHTVRAADGVEAPWDALISTAPVTECVELAGLDRLRSAAGRLRWSSTHVVGVGLRGRPDPELASRCWMYFAEADAPFYRVTHFSHYSPHNVPDIERGWSLMAEVSESPWKRVDAEAVVAETLDGLERVGLIEGRGQVVHTWQGRIEYSYPTPDLGRDAALEELLPALERVGIYSRGRFGAWKYEVANQDHAFMQGVEVVDRLLDNRPEVTLNSPEIVNAPRGK